MRREFVFVILVIISIFTLSSLITEHLHYETEKLLLDTVVGVVGAGNFSYWHLRHMGPLVIELTSLSGDADIYISMNISPSYEIERNDFSSATCGIDVVTIPAGYPRPMWIGVYGHWSHTHSEYSIKIYMPKEARDIYDRQTDAEPTAQEAELIADLERFNANDEALSRDTDDEPAPEIDTEDENKPRFQKLLNILDMLFETYFL